MPALRDWLWNVHHHPICELVAQAETKLPRSVEILTLCMNQMHESNATLFNHIPYAT